MKIVSYKKTNTIDSQEDKEANAKGSRFSRLALPAGSDPKGAGRKVSLEALKR